MSSSTSSETQKAIYNDIAIRFPDSWVDNTIVSAVGPIKGQFRPNLIVAREDLDGADLTAHVDAQVKELTRKMKNYRLHRREATKAADRDAILLEHSFKSRENIFVRQLQVLVQKGRLVYALSMSHQEGAYNEVRATFDEIMKTFEVR